MLARVDLVTIGAIAEVAPPHDAAFLHRRETAVHGHEVATAFLHPLVQLLRREWPMLACQDAEDRLAWFGHALMIGAQHVQRGIELRLGMGWVVRHRVLL